MKRIVIVHQAKQKKRNLFYSDLTRNEITKAGSTVFLLRCFFWSGHHQPLTTKSAIRKISCLSTRNIDEIAFFTLRSSSVILFESISKDTLWSSIYNRNCNSLNFSVFELGTSKLKIDWEKVKVTSFSCQRWYLFFLWVGEACTLNYVYFSTNGFFELPVVIHLQLSRWNKVKLILFSFLKNFLMNY